MQTGGQGSCAPKKGFDRHSYSLRPVVVLLVWLFGSCLWVGRLFSVSRVGEFIFGDATSESSSSAACPALSLGALGVACVCGPSSPSVVGCVVLPLLRQHWLYSPPLPQASVWHAFLAAPVRACGSSPPFVVQCVMLPLLRHPRLIPLLLPRALVLYVFSLGSPACVLSLISSTSRSRSTAFECERAAFVYVRYHDIVLVVSHTPSPPHRPTEYATQSRP